MKKSQKHIWAESQRSSEINDHKPRSEHHGCATCTGRVPHYSSTPLPFLQYFHFLLCASIPRGKYCTFYCTTWFESFSFYLVFRLEFFFKIHQLRNYIRLNLWSPAFLARGPLKGVWTPCHMPDVWVVSSSSPVWSQICFKGLYNLWRLHHLRFRWGKAPQNIFNNNCTERHVSSGGFNRIYKNQRLDKHTNQLTAPLIYLLTHWRGLTPRFGTTGLK